MQAIQDVIFAENQGLTMLILAPQKTHKYCSQLINLKL